jgi:hypothetical protein
VAERLECGSRIQLRWAVGLIGLVYLGCWLAGVCSLISPRAAREPARAGSLY